MKNIVFFDIDGTLVKGQSQKILVKFLFKEKEINLYYLISILVWFIFYKCKFVKDPKKIMEFAFRLIKGRTTESVEKLMESFYSQVLANLLYPDIIDNVKNHQAEGDNIVLLTNVLTPLANIVGKHLQISDIIATELEIKDNVYTGRIVRDIVYGEKKLYYAKEYLSRISLEYDKIYYYADHNSDIAMLDYVDEPRVVRPDNILYKFADSKGWQIVAR